MRAREQLITQASRRAQREDRWGGMAFWVSSFHTGPFCGSVLCPSVPQLQIQPISCSGANLVLSRESAKALIEYPLDCTSQPLGRLRPCVLVPALLLPCSWEQGLLHMCPSSSGRFSLNLNLGKPTWFVQDCPGFSTESPMFWEISQFQVSKRSVTLQDPIRIMGLESPWH